MSDTAILDTLNMSWAVKLVNEHCYQGKEPVSDYKEFKAMDWVMLCLLDNDYIPLFISSLDKIGFDTKEAAVLMKHGIEAILPEPILESSIKKLNTPEYEHLWQDVITHNPKIEAISEKYI